MLSFCENCHDMVEYFVKDERKNENIKGKQIEFMGKEAYCEICESEIFVHEIRDYNLKQLDEAFREKNGLILVSEIEKILEKYNIGKRPLSLLLGWGELTLTRYLNGDIPTKQYSDELQRLLDDVDHMKELLENNNDRITNDTYRRCKEAISKAENPFISGLNDKVDQVVKYILFNSTEITPLALQKLLYFSQGFFKAFTGSFMFDDDCEAWVHGPVYRDIYYKYKDFGYDPIKGKNYEFGNIELSELEKEIIDNVIKNFGCYSGKVLEKMTHGESPWRQTRIDLKDDENSTRIIDKEMISEYFNEIKSKFKMVNISDIEDYSVNLFQKVHR